MDANNASLWSLLLAAGPLVWPILLCSVFASAIIIERYLYLRRIKIRLPDFLNGLFDHIKHNRIKEALEFCEKSDSPVSRILKSGILKYDRPRTQIKEAMDDAWLYELPEMEKGMVALATIARISPLLGLLGTVAGMVRSFQAMQAGAALSSLPAATLSAGIWQALLSAMAGLLVAIPAYIAYNYFVSRLKDSILDMERAATELVNLLAE